MDQPDRPTASRPAQLIAHAALAVTLIGLGLWTLRGFLSALVWAAILAVALGPLYSRTCRRWPGQARAVLPALFTAGVALVLLLPLSLLLVELGREAMTLFAEAREALRSGLPVPAWVGLLPVGAEPLARWWERSLADPAGIAALLGRLDPPVLLAEGRAIGAALAHRAVQFGFTLLTLFFLFRHGALLAEQLLRVSRQAFGAPGERVLRQMALSVHGTVDGLVLVGLAEGLILGIAYAVAGVPHPTVLGALTALAAMIPFAAPLVFGVAAVLLLMQGMLAAAAAILALGTVVLFVADHFVRPALIGGATRLPFLLALLGILGGVETFGLLGLFLGPALMAALVLLWREWAER